MCGPQRHSRKYRGGPIMSDTIITLMSEAPSTVLAILVWYEVKHMRQSITKLAVHMAKLEIKHGKT